MALNIEDHEILEHLKPENGGATTYELGKNPELPINKKQAYYLIHQKLKNRYNIKTQKDPDNKKRKRYYYHPPNNKPKTNNKNTKNKKIKPADNEEILRKPTDNKKTLKNKANEYLHTIEQLTKQKTKKQKPVQWNTQPKNKPDTQDLIIHETDTHIGAEVKNQFGETIYNTDTAIQKIKQRIDTIIKRDKQKNTETETVHLLLGGDIITGENIYDTQPHEIDNTINTQIQKATKTYYETTKKLSKNYKHLQIVCAQGNHGQIKAQGTSKHANADDILYNNLKLLINNTPTINNTQLVKTDTTNHTLFNIRNHTAYLTHGDQYSKHAGTSSPQRDWIAAKEHYNFDAAFRGHYHHHRTEYVQSTPIIMTPSQKPTDNYEDQNQLYNKPINTYYYANKNTPIAETHTINTSK